MGIRFSLEKNDPAVMMDYKYNVLVCGDTGCLTSGCKAIIDALNESVTKHKLEKDVNILTVGCFGICSLGPIVIVYPGGYFYGECKAEEMERVVTEHLMGDTPVKELLYKETVSGEEIIPFAQTGFYKKQERNALRNCGIIEPDNLNEYIGNDGYMALAKALSEMTRDEVIKTVRDSGLRGRGGGGFPTGLKWEFTRKVQSEQKYVACNADEGDPGAFMDRAIIEGAPHVVVEAMAIAGYAVGADHGYIYIRAEYPVAVKRLERAIKNARERGLLGKNILGTGYNFDIEIRLGAGAFVCGEETALIASIEGKRGEPRPRPPYPAVKGIFGKPTLLNNVETYANIPPIILRGADWFASMGTKKSKGSKVFAIGGKVTNTGLIEVPMGITLREVVEEIGGGVPGGKKFKAAQTGGPSGGCIPDIHYDVPIDYDNLVEIGSMMGSGGLIVMDEDNCMVDMARFFLDFTVDESCGKCAPCRIGTKRLLELLDKLIEGKGEAADLDKIEELCQHINVSSLCALGQTASNPVISMMKYFRDEYVAHAVDHKCPSGVCKDLLTYFIIAEKCIGCTLCARVCPTNAISGKVKEKHIIDPDKCIKCGVCVEKCKPGAIIRK
ncbi:MAG: NADH-quinone oxidoreductase subunit NuoF [Oscillospiraceae bacterium]|nr:NADH-quinone oxidoreductase subunit NuoF [Oscillospiraceae bacterium]